MAGAASFAREVGIDYAVSRGPAEFTAGARFQFEDEVELAHVVR